MTDQEFIHVYQTCSESQVRKITGLSRSAVRHRYKTLTFKAYNTVKTCIECKNQFTYIVKSYRDQRKTCFSCQKKRMGEINKKYIQGEPSHRRLNLNRSLDYHRLYEALKGTCFVSIRQDPGNPLNSIVMCTCGKEIFLATKLLLRSQNSRKNSCGCANRKSTGEREIKEYLHDILDIPAEELTPDRLLCRD